MSKNFPQVRWLKSQPITQEFNNSQIDEANGILKDVVMCQVGPAKGHGVNIEQEFINALVAYDIENYAENGIKARFGHPAMSDTTMGAQMGYFKNFRIRDNQAIADLHLLDAAEISPNKPQMKSWVLQMAAEAPDFIMSSIVFRPGAYYQRKEDGSKYQIWYYKTVVDEDDNERQVWVRPKEDLGEIYVELGDHYYTDLVESGAATENLFASKFNSDKFAVQASEWLSEHPQILDFLKENPNKLAEFAQKVGLELPKKASKFSLNSFFSKRDKSINLQQYIHVNEHHSAIEAYEEQIEKMNTAFTAIEENFKAEIAQLQEKIKELEALPVHNKLEFETTEAGENAGKAKYFTSFDRNYKQ